MKDRRRRKVTVVGNGNVGTVFGLIFDSVPVSSRTLENLPLDSDLYLIAVSDAAVTEVAGRFPEVDGVVAHTTGSVSMDVLFRTKAKRYGVFYPLQTLSRQRAVKAEDIPLLLEASDDETLKLMVEVAREYGFASITEADGDMRRKAHLAAAFSCNFINAMIGVGVDILCRCGIAPSILQPLIKETISKLDTMSPREAQTGPARRGDEETMAKHKDLLLSLGMEEENRVYSMISEIISKKTQKK